MPQPTPIAVFDNGSSGPSKTIDWNNSPHQKLTLTANCTLTFTNPLSGGRYRLLIAQDATGLRLITWPTIRWTGGTAPVLTTTALKVDRVELDYDSSEYFGLAHLNL